MTSTGADMVQYESYTIQKKLINPRFTIKRKSGPNWKFTFLLTIGILILIAHCLCYYDVNPTVAVSGPRCVVPSDD